MPITTLFIDKTDTLIKKNRTEHIEKSARLLGVPTQKFYEAYHWTYLDYSSGKIRNDNEYYKLILKKLGMPPNGKIMKKLHEIFMNAFELYPQTHTVLKALKKKYKLIMLSNHVSAWIDAYLKRFRLKEYFDDVIISDAVGVRKPDPEIFKIAMKRAGCKPEECAFIDDKEKNVEAARKLGMCGIVVDPKLGIPRDIDEQLR